MIYLTFSPSIWAQLIMNNLVMPGLVVVLFITMIAKHKEEINNHTKDKEALQKQLNRQTDICCQQSDILKDISLVIERISTRLENVEKIVMMKH